MTAILALDSGTTGSTALVVADDGRILGRGYREITQHFPEPGQVEHDPEEIFRKALGATREALQRTKVVPAALGITNQRANDWLMQFQADLLGVPVARPDVIETTALGAAGLAGLAAGIWKTPEQFLAGRHFTRFTPSPEASARRARTAEWHRAVDAALHWAVAGRGRRRPP